MSDCPTPSYWNGIDPEYYKATRNGFDHSEDSMLGPTNDHLKVKCDDEDSMLGATDDP